MKNKVKIYPIELITGVWALLTGLYIVVVPHCIRETTLWNLLSLRLGVIVVLTAIVLSDTFLFRRKLAFIRQLLPLALIIQWYPETYYYNQAFFSSIDKYLIAADQWICGFQPSTSFSVALPYAWFNELMNFSYMTFFPALAFTPLYFYFRDKGRGYYAAFILLCSFLIYYSFFVIFPSEGPQFFVCHSDDIAIPVMGPFRKFLLLLHSRGELPTGAIPSSHIGIMCVYMILFWKNARKVFFWILPFSLLLAMSTVYIKAHYFIDVIAGMIFAYPTYFVSDKIWRFLYYEKVEN